MVFLVRQVWTVASCFGHNTSCRFRSVELPSVGQTSAANGLGRIARGDKIAVAAHQLDDSAALAIEVMFRFTIATHVGVSCVS